MKKRCNDIISIKQNMRSRKKTPYLRLKQFHDNFKKKLMKWSLIIHEVLQFTQKCSVSFIDTLISGTVSTEIWDNEIYVALRGQALSAVHIRKKTVKIITLLRRSWS